MIAIRVDLCSLLHIYHHCFICAAERCHRSFYRQGECNPQAVPCPPTDFQIPLNLLNLGCAWMGVARARVTKFEIKWFVIVPLDQISIEFGISGQSVQRNFIRCKKPDFGHRIKNLTSIHKITQKNIFIFSWSTFL